LKNKENISVQKSRKVAATKVFRIESRFVFPFFSPHSSQGTVSLLYGYFGQGGSNGVLVLI
jgi:hypothetical protein